MKNNTILKSDTKFFKNRFEYIHNSDKIFKKNIKIPENFDGRIIWKKYLTPISDQDKCGSCWAIAAVNTLADRFNIQSKGKINVELSPTKLILCNSLNKNINKFEDNEYSEIFIDEEKNFNNTVCFGNTLYDAWTFLKIVGTTDIKCLPYNKTLLNNNLIPISSFTSIKNLPLCDIITGPMSDMCYDYNINLINNKETGTPAKFYSAYYIYNIEGENNEVLDYNIRRDIYIYGPVSTAFFIYPDFYEFNSKSDIYIWNGKGKIISGHAVEIVGWGNEKNIPYWIIKNSYGISWGDNGYFRMLRGVNMCEIEKNIITGDPDFFYPEYFSPPHISHITSINTLKQKYNYFKNFYLNHTTGYSKRIESDKQYLIKDNNIFNYKNLPDFTTFVAGENEDINLQKHITYNNKIYYNFKNFLFIIFIIIIIYLFLKFIFRFWKIIITQR
jgi:cathepsin B